MGAHDSTTIQEQTLFDLVNADRVDAGLSPVEVDFQVLGVARARAAAQLRQEALSHYDESGELALVRLLSEAGAEYSLAGENLAWTNGAEPSHLAHVEHLLMTSPPHRRNILEPSFSQPAVGIVGDEGGRVGIAQIFRALD